MSFTAHQRVRANALPFWLIRMNQEASPRRHGDRGESEPLMNADRPGSTEV